MILSGFGDSGDSGEMSYVRSRDPVAFKIIVHLYFVPVSFCPWQSYVDRGIFLVEQIPCVEAGAAFQKIDVGLSYKQRANRLRDISTSMRYVEEFRRSSTYKVQEVKLV